MTGYEIFALIIAPTGMFLSALAVAWYAWHHP